jgi:chemotaxis protein methyltransferase CheR
MIEQNGFSNLKQLILNKAHLDISQYKDSYIQRRVNTRLNLTNSSNLTDYLALLKNDPDEIKCLMDSLTVNVTEFFRNMETFEGLENDIIPKIIKEKENDSRDIIKVWSAGCASGEETYSLTILFLEGLRKSKKDYRLMVFGTDIDSKSLMKAKIGSYEKSKVGGIRTELLEKYFDNIDSEYKIKPCVKQHIKFSSIDLTGDIEKNVTTYDLIVCRNVVIYFKTEVKEVLFLKFYKMLRKNGYLVLGKNESIIGPAMQQLKNVNLAERIYQKPIKY